ncbi:MAG: Sec-independent protein translocase protein TatB [Pseudomonadota bacterium]
MLPQIGMTEFLLLAAVALIVLGPKDLSMAMRKLGQFVARGRAMAREFQGAFDDIAKQAELDDLRKEIEDLKRNNAMTEAKDSLSAVEADINAAVMRGDPSPAKPKKKAVPTGEAADDYADGKTAGEAP